MKKSVLFLLMTLMSWSLFAAFQYEIVVEPRYSGPSPGISGYAYYVRVTEGSGSIYITDKISSLGGGNDEVLSAVLKSVNDTSTYGWVDRATGQVHEADGSSIVLYHDRINQWNEYVTQTGYKLGDFQAGDEFGVWLTAEPKKSNYSGPDLTGASILDKTSAVNSDKINYREYGFDFDVWGNPLAQMSFKDQYKTVFFGFYGEEGMSFDGKPLPGMLATFLLGGSALGAAGLRRKKKRS